MAKSPTFSTITAAFASASKLNANNAEVTVAFDNTLSRDGSTPNTMTADFDMNSNNIVNVNSLDVDTFILGGTVVTAGTLPAAVPVRDFDTKVVVAATNVDTDFNFIRTAGLSSIGDGGGALYKAVGGEPSHALKVQSSDGQWWEGVVPFMTPEMFGAAGTGSPTNDLTKLQDMFDCPVSDTIMFGTGKTYYYETNGSADNLTVTRAMHIRTNGSTLHHKSVGGSSNNALTFKTTQANEETWTETILAYATVLNITTSLAVGDRILVELGDNVTDPTVAHVFLWTTIIANGGTSITIDKPIPIDVTGTGHSLWPVTPNEGTHIDVLRFVQEGNTVSVLHLETIRAFNLGSLVVQDGTIALSIVEGCEGIKIGNVSGIGRDGGSGSTRGGFLTSWGSKNIRIGTVDWTMTTRGRAILIEAGTVDCHIGQFNFKRVSSEVNDREGIVVDGNSELHVGRYTLTSDRDDLLMKVGQGGNNILIVDDLVIWATPVAAAFDAIKFADKLYFQGTRYADKVQLTKRTFINEVSSYDLEWFTGVPRRAFVRIDDTTKVNSILMKYEDDTTNDLLGLLTSGEWLDVTNRVAPNKALSLGTRFRLRMGGNASDTAVFDTWVEYWRDPDDTVMSELAPWDENRGEVTDTTDGSGDIVIAHGLGSEPRVVHVQMQGTTDYNPTVHTKGSTNFTVRVSDAAGAAKTSTAVTVSWSASV